MRNFLFTLLFICWISLLLSGCKGVSLKTSQETATKHLRDRNILFSYMHCIEAYSNGYDYCEVAEAGLLGKKYILVCNDSECIIENTYTLYNE